MLRLTRLLKACTLGAVALAPALSRAEEIRSASSLPFEINSDTPEGTANYSAPVFPIGPFTKYSGNPILSPNPANDWESAYVYNPTAIVLNETVFLLYRAQNASKTSSIGLAWSTDGYNFTRLNEPVLYATEPWETIGGTEDPRIVRVAAEEQGGKKQFYLTYTGYDNKSAQLCLAYGENLLNWTKLPPLFPNWQDVAFSDIGIPSPRLNHSKSGAVFSEKINGVYHMLHGDSRLYHATSPDMLNWTSLPADNYWAAPVHAWENRLIESGPAPIKTRDGRWLTLYNGMTTGAAGYPQNQYSVGQMLWDPSGAFRPNISVPQGTYQPALRDGPIARVENPILVPESAEEQQGQVDQVVFVEGLVQFKGKWL